MSRGTGLLTALALLGAAPAITPLSGQAADTLRIAAGPQYEAHATHRFFFGTGYREIWTTAFRVPVLDLERYAGGLEPVGRTGGLQTRALRFKAADGREFFFRSLDKDPSSVLPPELLNTVAASIVQDQTKSALPTAPLVVSRLLRAAGIPHAEPVIVALPDHPALGEFRPVFANLVGTLEARVGGGGPNEHFGGALEIVSTDSLTTLVRRTASDRVDAAAFLRARLFDLLIGDWDRHRDQWRWALFDSTEPRRWQPIPLDRDQAFARYDGFLLGIARQAGSPQLTNFDDDYPGMTGATWNGRDLDRRFLAGLGRAEWDSVAQNLSRAITDSVIHDAVRALPPEHYEIIGQSLVDRLRHRRDRLPEAARLFYSHLAGQVDVHGTEGADRATITRAAGGAVELTLTAAGDSVPFLARRFRPDETSDLRLFLDDGADTAVVRGEGGGIDVRILGDGGTDLLADSARGGANHFYDDPGAPTRTAGTSRGVDRGAWQPPKSDNPKAPPPRDWGHRWQASILASAGPDLGVFFGGGETLTRYGFRKLPFSSRHRFRLGFATGPAAFRGDYRGEWMVENSHTGFELLAKASGIEVTRFHGFGNETQAPRDDEFYRVTQQQYLISPLVTFQLARRLTFAVGPEVKLVHTDARTQRFLVTQRPYGAGTFGEVGAGADLVFDSRNRGSAATRGARLALGGTIRPSWWDVSETFGDLHGEGTLFLSAALPLGPTLSFRAGGRKLWGDYPYFEAAFIGDRGTVRLSRENRFAGDASAYGSTELRLSLFRMTLLVPTDVGVFGLADAGRVFLEGESSNTWHTAFGGGLWLGFLGPAHTVSLAVAASEERTGVYVQGGFGF